MSPQEDQQLREAITETNILNRLAYGDIPTEIVKHILGDVVSLRCPSLLVRSEYTIPAFTIELLGKGEAAQSLYPLMQQAILENATICLEVDFGRLDPQSIRIPAFVSQLPSQIHHLQIDCPMFVRWPVGNLTQVSAERLSNGIPCVPALKATFPNLKSVTVRVRPHMNPDLARQYRDTFRDGRYDQLLRNTPPAWIRIIINLLEALEREGPGKEKNIALGDV